MDARLATGAGWVGLVGAVSIILGLTGCGSMPEVKLETPEEVRELEAGYRLLSDLLGDERRVDGILLVKAPPAEVRRLIKDIAAFTGRSQDELEERSELPPRVALDRPAQLPRIEAATREAIDGEIQKDLLFGDHFRVRLLISQAQALQYGRFLCQELGKADPNDERSEWLGEVAEGFEDRYERVVAALDEE